MNNKKLLTLVLLALATAFNSGAATPVQVAPELVELEQKVVNTVAHVKDSVVAIVMKSETGQTVGSGSGVIVSKQGLIFTAAHVVDGQEEVTVIMADETEHQVRVLGMNHYKDAAVCRMLDTRRTYPYAEIGDSDALEVTDWVIAMGHGRGYDKTRTPPVRFGRVRAHNPGRFITTDCPLIGGDSGGPVFDLTGNLVAINSSINGLAKFNVHAGVSGFRDDLTRMRSGEIWGTLKPNVIFTPETPLLGVNWADTSYRDPRPVVGTVPRGGPAAKGGIRPGDIIRKVADEEVSNSTDVMIALGRQKAGNTITIVLERDRQLFSTKVTLISRSDANEYRSSMPRLAETEDSPYVKESDKPKLDKQIVELIAWASPLEQERAESYVQLYDARDLSTPLLHATVISDGVALAPLSAFQKLPERLIAWRPGLDAYPSLLVGGYEEHDLAVISIPGLESRVDLTNNVREVKLGEFIATVSNIETHNSLNKLGVVSVEKRNLGAFFGVLASNEDSPYGVKVKRPIPGKAAYYMGIRRDDIITSFNGNKIRNFEDFKTEIDKLKIGDEVEAEIMRKGQIIKLKSTIGGKSSDGGRIGMMDQLGRNTLSENTSSFRTVIQSDILVEPEECGAPVFSLDGGFVGIAISDAGRNKTYIIPAAEIVEAIKEKPRPITEKKRAQMAANNDRFSQSTPRGGVRRSRQHQLDSLFGAPEIDDLFRKLGSEFGNGSLFQEMDELFKRSEEMSERHRDLLRQLQEQQQNR